MYDQPLFKEKIEAWASGPVIQELFNTHKGLYRLDSIPWGNPGALNETQKETVMAVLDYYGHKSLQWLSDLTHLEDPWNKARNGLLSDQRGHNVITLESVSEYYSSLSPDS